ncbi:MAG: hypothetical protein KBG48_08840 [Kofleriaceae bacterium]|nr:hypothetical protein [Kofleriaceae bacterium]MBP9167480.1 hypothetical protein [Kofleriaceae bacterium]MBP9861030.1 hypothetical protein [Kofleriaceae bacterium]
MDISDALLAPEAPDYTPRRPILRGTFSINKSSIPYFQGLMTLEEVEKELKLVENLPSDLRSMWRLEELFQREIDWDRVKVDIVNGYLRQPAKLQFFNALTVALLPLNDRRMLDKDYGVAGSPPPLPDALAKSPWESKEIGGVQLVTAPKSTNGFISWDKRRIFAATIDGQHRLAALQELVRAGNLPLSTLTTSIPVIFLVLDPAAGLAVPDSQFADDANKILGIVREVFIDLNKSAKAVLRARRILLDDQEIESRCVRQLLAPRIGEVTRDRLPLGLVHWQHNVTAKFNAGKQTGPFVTTVELLYSIVKDVLEISPPKDPLEEAYVRKFVASVEDSLRVSELVAANPDRYQGVPKLISYVEQHYLRDGFEQPFSNLPGPYLRAADDGFRRYWQPLFISILMGFKPYKEFIEQVRARGGLDGELAFYLALPERAQAAQSKEWGEDRIAKIEKPLDELARMKIRDWPFYAVFQKGMFRASATVLRHTVSPDDLEGTQAFLQDWNGFLDAIYDEGLLEVHAHLERTGNSELWFGVALNPGGRTVKWNEATVDRINYLLLLWWYVYRNRLRLAKRFLAAVAKPKSNERFPNARDAVKEISKSLKSAVQGPDEEITDEELELRVNARLVTILDRVCRLTPANVAADGDEEGDAEPSASASVE